MARSSCTEVEQRKHQPFNLSVSNAAESIFYFGHAQSDRVRVVFEGTDAYTEHVLHLELDRVTVNTLTEVPRHVTL